MATFSGNAAGYRVDLLNNGKVRVLDIDAGDGDTGSQVFAGHELLEFNDRSYQLTTVGSAVNATAAGVQFDSDIATLADGSYVVTWTSSAGEDNRAIYARRFDAAGNPLGGDMLVTSTEYPGSSAVAALAGGGFVVTWTTYDMYYVSPPDVHAQRFDADGNAVGGEIVVNATTAGHQEGAAIAGLADGGFVITWESGGDVYAQRYNAAGNTVGGETLINTTTEDTQFSPAIAALAGGGYVITWAVQFDGVYAQRFNAAGNAVGGETRVNTSPVEMGMSPVVTALDGGGYVVGWVSEPGAIGEGWIATQRYDAAGNAVGGEMRVNTVSSNYASKPDITELAGGGYVVTWTDALPSDDGFAIYARLYDAAGNAVGAEQRVSVVNTAYNSAVTALDDGGFVLTWHTYHSGLNSEDDAVNDIQIHSRRFDEDGNAVPDGKFALLGTPDDDVMNGGPGGQIFTALGGDDILNGGLGDDELYGGHGNDSLNGGDGSDILEGSHGDDSLVGNAGDDHLLGGYGNDTLDGGVGNDWLHGGEGNNTLNGGAGDDVISTSDASFLRGSYGDDELRGGYEADTLNGGTGNDKLDGGDGRDILNGGAGDDILGGSYRGDRLYGGAGNDVLNGGNRIDRLIGGEGSDTFVFDVVHQSGAHADFIVDFSAGDGDVIHLDNDTYIFEKLVDEGALDPDHFVANAAGMAQDADDYIVYETDTGILYYDANGNGAGGRAVFATVGFSTHPALTAADFMVV